MKYGWVARKSCPTCNSLAFATLYEEGFSEGKTGQFIKDYYDGRITAGHLGDGRYHLVRCSNCTLIFQKNILDEAGLYDLYERAIDPVESLNKRELASSEYFTEILRSASVLGTLFKPEVARSTKVLDFGMGWGHWAMAAKALGVDVVGAELSEDRIAFAESHGIDVVDAFGERVYESYDFINTDQVFEHLAAPDKTLKMLVPSLKKNGVIKIFVPNATPVYRKIRAKLWTPGKDAFSPLEHINGFNFRSLVEMARLSGLSPLRTEEVSTGFRQNARNKLKHFSNVPSWFFRRL